MEDICWFTFTSVCVTLFVGALTAGLEGYNNTNNQTPFNLVSILILSVHLLEFTICAVRIFVHPLLVRFTLHACQETPRQRSIKAR